MPGSHQVVEGVPSVEEVIDLLTEAYGGWGGEELFKWKYSYPGTAEDFHHLYIKSDSKITAFARLYHRELSTDCMKRSVVIRGNAAVHPDHQQMGQYRALHNATQNHCGKHDIDLVMTYNRKDNYSFQTSAKSSWSYIELPLYLAIMSPEAVLKEYASSIIEQNQALVRLTSGLGNRFYLGIDGNPVSVSSLVGSGQPPKWGPTFHLSETALRELIGLMGNEASMLGLVQKAISLLTRREITPLSAKRTSLAPTEIDDVDVCPPNSHTKEDINQILTLYREVRSEEAVKFRRERRDLNHMLQHPNLLGTLMLERADRLVGFAPIYATKTGEVIEGRVADLVYKGTKEKGKLVDAIREFCQSQGVDIVVAFDADGLEAPWIRIRRHVLMWEQFKTGNPELKNRDFELGFYDVV